MPRYTFTSPEGKTYDIDGPEGSTKEQAFQILQGQLAAPKKSDVPALAPMEGRKAPPEPSRGIGEKIVGGAETALSTLTGIPATVAGQAYGIGRNLFGQDFGTQKGIQEAERAAQEVAGKLTYQPKTEAGREMAQTLGQRFEQSKLAGLPVEGPLLGRIPEVPVAARATGELAQGAAGTGARAAGRAALRALPEVDPETLQLARQAHNLGFRLRPDQIYGSKFGKYAGEFSSNIPLTGGGQEFNQNVFNRRIVEALGGEGDKLTRKTFSDAMKKSGGEIGAITEKAPTTLDPIFTGQLRAHAQDAERFQTTDVARVVNSYIDEIVSKSENGVVPGKTMRAIDTKLGSQIRSTANGDLKTALSDLQETLRDGVARNLSPEDLQALNDARRRYAIGKTVEPLVAKSPTGNIAPSSLLGAVTATKAGKSAMAKGAAGQLGTLADIGQRFLKEPGTSGTAERALTQSLLTGGVGGAAAVAPGVTLPAAATLYGGANLYNRLGPSLTEQLIARPPRQ